MNTEKKGSTEKWLDEGYRQFAEFGPNGLSINHVSKEIASSRASFYHFFGDQDIFIDELLEKHLGYCAQFDLVGHEQCSALYPDLYDLLGKYTIPLQFSLQLFRHRQIPRYNYIFLKTFERSSNAFAMKLFADYFDLSLSERDVYNVWLTMGEAWYSRLDPNDLSAETLQNHSKAIVESVSALLDSKFFASF